MAQILINTSTPNDGLGDPLRSAVTSINTMFTELYAQTVFKEAGKGLSSNDFTSLLLQKLNAIASDAEKNVQSDLLQEDITADDFIKNKDAVLPGRTPTQIEIFAGLNTFTLPVDAIVMQVFLVRTVLFEFDEWTQAGNILTISKTMNTGNRIQITFY